MATQIGRGDYRVQSVARAGLILFEIGKTQNGLTPKEISSALGLNAQTVYHLLHTLTALGLVTRRSDRYILGLQTAVLGEAFSRQMAPPEYFGPAVREIAEITGETAQAFGWHAGEIAAISIAPGRFPVQASARPYGSSQSAHARATGKLLLAYASQETRDDYLRRNPPSGETAQTLTDREELEEEFARIREQGYAVDHEEFYEGLCCVATPLSDGLSDFGFGLSAPSERFHANFDSYLETMQRVARSLAGPGPDRDGEDR